MSHFTAHDSAMMAKALQLARLGRFTTSPNPNVGCVICNPVGEVVGEGWHRKAGSPHAEVHALRQAGTKSLGATAYVTLEPCSHTGRTPPCAEALVKAGIKRVVVAMEDPNPLVVGQGMQKLKDAGIEVSSGLLGAEAEQLNRGFCKRMREGRPWVTVKLAASLDGKTALANGESKWITGPEARSDVQRHRGQSCAILSGSGTVLADNPSLNVRYSEMRLASTELNEQDLRQPLRVILDGRNQLIKELQLYSLAGDVLVINSQHNERISDSQAQQWQAPYNGKQLDLAAVMEHLGALQCNSVWVEAGAKLAGALLQNKLVDELILYQAPKLIGHLGQNLFAMNEVSSMQEAFELSWQDIRQVGKDLKIVAKVHYD